MVQFMKKLNIFIILILFAGCSPVTSPVSTSTLMPTTFVFNPTPTETITPEYRTDLVVQNCVDILPSMPKDFVSNGIIPLYYYQMPNITFLDLEIGDETEILPIDKNIQNYAMSPDGRTLAYKVYEDKRALLVLTGVANTSYEVVINEYGDFALYYWLNNQQMVLGKDNKWVVLNPYTQEEKNYTLDNFPDYDTFNQYNIWVGFDPQEKIAIYKNKNGNTAILDIDTKQLLSEIQDSVQRPPVAAWAADGSQAAIVGATQLGQYLSQSGDNIFGVERSGQTIQLSHLAEQYGVGVSIHSLSWSPSSRYIAFWMWNFGITNWHLAVLDMVTKKVTDYCISTDFNTSMTHPLTGIPSPIWSPDSKQIIVEQRTENSGYTVLLDIDQNIAFRIAENAMPLGWMVMP